MDAPYEKEKTKWYKWLVSNPIIAGIISNLLVIAILYVFSVYNLVPSIRETNDNVKSIKNDISLLKENYLSRDLDGVEIKVGINSNLEGNNVAVFKNNKVGLRFTNALFATNPINRYCSTIKLLVSSEIEKNGDKSDAEIFVSKEAADILGFTRYRRQGIFILKIKKIEMKEK
jgi:hypothetical protein